MSEKPKEVTCTWTKVKTNCHTPYGILIERVVNIHGISQSNSPPLWSPIPPAVHRRPEPASMSLPVPYVRVLPASEENTKHLDVADVPYKKEKKRLQTYSNILCLLDVSVKNITLSHG